VALYTEQESVQQVLHNTAPEITNRLQAISLFCCMGILQHHFAIFIIRICQGEGMGGKPIEKCLFGIQVVHKITMIVEMVVCDVGEDASCKIQPGDTLLMNGVGAYFHEAISASGICHFF